MSISLTFSQVTLYVNATGLMWEHAFDFGALLVWAEHRYYGKSLPLGSVEACLENKTFLSVEQALADHSAAIKFVRGWFGVTDEAATIGFGGSYGGMLATWLRLSQPDVLDGVVAASAPVLSFEGETPPCDPNFYAQGVTYDVSPAAGVSIACQRNMEVAFAGEALAKLGASAQGRTMLAEGLHLCNNSLRDVSALEGTQGSHVTLSMTFRSFAVTQFADVSLVAIEFKAASFFF